MSLKFITNERCNQVLYLDSRADVALQSVASGSSALMWQELSVNPRLGWSDRHPKDSAPCLFQAAISRLALSYFWQWGTGMNDGER